MDKARAAEWLLARVSTKRRAAEIVGDLLEAAHPPLAFWFTVTRICFALGSRIFLAPLLAIFSFAIPLVAFSLSGNAWHHVPHHVDPWMRVSTFLMIAGMFLWTVPALALIRFGRRDPVTLIAFPLAILLTLCSTFAWLPLALYGIAATFALSILALCLHRTTRRSLLCILVAVGSCALLATSASKAVLSIHTIYEHYNTLAGFLIWSISICVEAWVMGRLHTHLLSDTAEPAVPPSSRPA